MMMGLRPTMVALDGDFYFHGDEEKDDDEILNVLIEAPFLAKVLFLNKAK